MAPLVIAPVVLDQPVVLGCRVIEYPEGIVDGPILDSDSRLLAQVRSRSAASSTVSSASGNASSRSSGMGRPLRIEAP